MLATERVLLLLISLLSFLFHCEHSLAFSLKDCTILYSENSKNISVTCAKRHLTAIPDDIPGNAVSLNLSLNGISNISRVDLRGLSKLEALYVKNNWILQIDDGTFADVVELKVLDLGENLLTALTKNMFQGLSKLETLSLDNNIISFISPVVFQPWSSYVYEIHTIKEHMLQSCSNLIELNLSFNNIKSMADNALPSMTQLRSLILQNNELSELPVAVQGLTTLEVYDLSSNDISELYCPYFWNLTSLTILDLSHNQISYIFDYKLQTLYLSSLQYLYIDLDECDSVDEGGFEGLDNLQILYLSEQRDRPFSNLQRLKKLHIKVHRGYYDISKDVLSGLTSLEYLITEAYFMGSLYPDTFKYTPQLKHLRISYSKLSVLTSDVFLPIPNLITLDLSNNKLRSLDFLAEAKLSALRWLNVSDNELFVISETVIQSLPGLTYLDLSANLLTCECSNYGLIQWIQGSKQTQVANAHQYTCAFPVSQRGKKFLDFGFDSYRIDAALLCFLFSSSLVVLTLLASFIYHFLRSHLTYAYYLFLAFLYDNKRRKKGIPHSYDAFVSYNVHDEAWVCGELLPELEGQQGWKLCLHHRDFEPGKPIVENITEAIYSSRKTICVISPNYLQSEWCSKEIQMARYGYQLFVLTCNDIDVLIMVFLEDIPANQLSPYYQIRSLVKRSSYLSWPQAGQHTGVFWQKIQQALEREENPAEHT
uniref:TIR domain-containing protein n=1 Tax=Maylandia zebra TaxID=106582 RepID=A0A3P9D3B9_9CICH